VELNDSVSVEGSEGKVSYIGHVEKLGVPNAIYVGLEMPSPGECESMMKPSLYTCAQCLPTMAVTWVNSISLAKRIVGSLRPSPI
jgi:hypothetical protein